MFFLPTVTDEYKDVDIPACDGMSIVANSLQDFGRWGRRVNTRFFVFCEISFLGGFLLSFFFVCALLLNQRVSVFPVDHYGEDHE